MGRTGPCLRTGEVTRPCGKHDSRPGHVRVRSLFVLDHRAQPTVNRRGKRPPETPRLFAKKLGTPSATLWVTLGVWYASFELRHFGKRPGSAKSPWNSGAETKRAGSLAPGRVC